MVNAHIQTRMRKLDVIVNTCRKKWKEAKAGEETGIEFELLISLLGYDFGSGRRYAIEIIRTLEHLKKIQFINKMVYYIPTPEDLEIQTLLPSEEELFGIKKE